jgi:hypothetical protein
VRKNTSRHGLLAHLCTCALVHLCVGALAASPLKFSGQVSGWAAGNYGTDWLGQGGIRYLPALALGGRTGFGFDLSANAWGEAATDFRDSLTLGLQAKPYRALVRYARPRFDARLGLQKINFGSATLLRPLMWFDRIDPRDPLQLTDGVYALLARYFFGRGGNVWAWGLLGNDSTKGWEWIPTEAWKPELGGRVQVQVPRGELAATYHYRQAYWSGPALPEQARHVREHRAGLDARWDLAIGVSVEDVVTFSQPAVDLFRMHLTPQWQNALSVGADYTIPLGNGLGLLTEHMLVSTADPEMESDARHLTAATVSYPLGLLDNLRGLVYYDWRNQGLYRFVSWQRTLDNWTFSIAGFWNPDRPQGFMGGSGGRAGAGKGIQLMVVFNH